MDAEAVAFANTVRRARGFPLLQLSVGPIIAEKVIRLINLLMPLLAIVDLTDAQDAEVNRWLEEAGPTASWITLCYLLQEDALRQLLVQIQQQ
jgi:hypothetical protein